MWSYTFIVYPPQDRATRFTDATVNNPTITPSTIADATIARDMAFGYIDDVTLAKPYRIYASGDRANDETSFAFTVTVLAGD